MAIESGSAVGIGLITKFGWIKLITLGAAGIGAGMMAIFRPPKSRREMFYQGLVALGSSLLFGNTIASTLIHTVPLLQEATAGFEDYLQFLIAIHGVVGALSWGAFGGLAHLRDKAGGQSLDETIKDVL